MKSMSLLAPLFAATMAVACPQVASAQDEMPFISGEYVEVSGIKIDDGHGLDYANHLAGMWRKGQAFAMEQGWITGYEVLVNSFPREGEPDVYLITRWTEWETPEEEEARAEAYRKHMAMNQAQMQEASGQRAEYRHLAGSMLLRAMKFRD